MKISYREKRENDYGNEDVWQLRVKSCKERLNFKEFERFNHKLSIPCLG